jgi:hypothetical protein
MKKLTKEEEKKTTRELFSERKATGLCAKACQGDSGGEATILTEMETPLL